MGDKREKIEDLILKVTDGCDFFKIVEEINSKDTSIYDSILFGELSWETFGIYGIRDENDEEYNKRIEKEKEEKEALKKYEKNLMKKLIKKYGGR